MAGALPHPEDRYQQREDIELAFVAALGPDGRRELVDAFVTAWERADVPALLQLLAEDARFTMPPLPAWFAGRGDIGRFLTERMFATPWRLVPTGANGSWPSPATRTPRAAAASPWARSTSSPCAADGSPSSAGSSTRTCTATSTCPGSDEFAAPAALSW